MDMRNSNDAVAHFRPNDVISFHRSELSIILAVYGRMVAAGEWKDYAMDFLRDAAVFSVFRRATEHPLYRILRGRPNGWQTPMSFFGMGQAQMELRGAAAAYIVRVGGQVRELLPLQTERVQVDQGEDWSLNFRVKFSSGAARRARSPIAKKPVLRSTSVTMQGPD